jgi:short-subunit dehydrogenase
MDNSRMFRSGTVMDARTVAVDAVNRLDRGGLVVPGFLNKLLIQSQRVAPRAMVTAITRGMNAGRVS